MRRGTIGMVAAMPDEIRPFLKRLKIIEKTMLDGFPLFSFSLGKYDCRLIESGIGIRRAERAAETLVKSVCPGLLISFGFGGAVKPGLYAGDLAVARRSILFGDKAISHGETIDLNVSEGIRQVMGSICEKIVCRLVQSDFITSEKILNKKYMRDILPEEISNPVLDMETWAIARTAGQWGIPFFAVRAISDAAEEELDFSLDEFTDNEMNIKITRVLRAISGKPRIIPQLLRLARNSRISGKNLAIALEGLLSCKELPLG